MFAITKRPTITEIHKLYCDNKATPTQIVQFFVNRIKENDKKINAFFCITEEIATAQANKYDQILKDTLIAKDFEGLINRQPLFGIPFALKAIILAEGEIFNASSKILNNFKAPYSSTVYSKILEAGGLLIGINNMDQFAMGSSGETCDYGIIRNPFDSTRIPGGSSAGGAASVGGGMVVFSLGTDTGGSIRQPAAFCDVVGLKPTYGLVSRFGVMPMASSFDQVGSMTNTVQDNIIVTRVIAGQDVLDQTTIDSSTLDDKLNNLISKQKLLNRKIHKINKTLKPLKIGIPKEFYGEGIDPIIQKSLDNLIKKLAKIGHTIVDISLPLNKYAIAVYYMTMSVEVAANLERIDGIRYAAQQGNYDELFFEHRGKYFGEEPKRRIMLGTYASSAGYYDAYYNQAQKVRELARQDFIKAFESCDLILTPTTPEFPFVIGDKSNDPLKMYLSDVFTCGINPVRIPGLNVPLGLFDVKNQSETVKLPTGCQILAPELSEDKIFELALEIENLVKNGEVE